jgi:cytidylate kinase
MYNLKNSHFKGELIMSIVTISRGSYSKGKEIAEKVAQQLGYGCIGRDAIIESSKEFNIPEIKLIRAIHDAPSILERFNLSKEKYLAYLRVTMLEHFQKDNVIYHGLAGHFFAKDISHLLKVRIIADMEDRVKLEMKRAGISKREALRLLKNDDKERRKWCKYIYGIDKWDPRLYDLVIHIKKITVNNATDIICHTVRLEQFKATPESQKSLDNMLIAAKVKAAVVDVKPDIEVFSENGTVLIKAKYSKFKDEAMIHKIEEIAKSVPGVRNVEFDLFAHLRD